MAASTKTIAVVYDAGGALLVGAGILGLTTVHRGERYHETP